MDEDLGKFISDFAQLVQLAQAGQHPKSGGMQLLAALTEHLQVPAERLAVVMEDIPPHRFVDADIVLAGLAREDPDSRLVGIGGGDQRHHQSLSDMLHQSRMFPHFPLSQPDYTNLAVGPDEQRQAVALGLWLFTQAGNPLAVLQRDANPRTAGSLPPLRFWRRMRRRPRISWPGSAAGCRTRAYSKARSSP